MSRRVPRVWVSGALLALCFPACRSALRADVEGEGAPAAAQQLARAREALDAAVDTGPFADAGRSVARAADALRTMTRRPQSLERCARALDEAGRALEAALSEGVSDPKGGGDRRGALARAIDRVALAGGLVARQSHEEALTSGDRSGPPPEEALPAAAADLAVAGRALIGKGGPWTRVGRSLVEAAGALSPEAGTAAAREQAVGLARRHVDLARAFLGRGEGASANIRATRLGDGADALERSAAAFAAAGEGFALVAGSVSSAAHWLKAADAALADRAKDAGRERCRALAARHLALASGLLAEADDRFTVAFPAGAESLSPRQLRASRVGRMRDESEGRKRDEPR